MARRDYDWDTMSPGMYPTDEDVLDVNLRAIVSDCRGLISGTLTPRSWADLSSTWSDDTVRQPEMHRTAKAKRNMSLARTRRQMVRILMSGGKSEADARIIARSLIRD
jgi:hypothetical protein